MDDQIHNQPTTEEHKPVAAPVMDIKPPVAIDKPRNLPADPAMSHSPETKSINHNPEAKQQAIPAAPKQPSNGIGGAIFATVVIVIVLAALATYAYIRTAN